MWQAEALVEHPADGRCARIVTSPTVRCIQTVEPLARMLGLPVEELDEVSPAGDVAALQLPET